MGLLKSIKVKSKSIVVGNLAAGGTGKTPVVLWLIDNYFEKTNMAVLSRGYGRKTQGFIEVGASANAMQCGDEPILLKQRHPNCPIFVCEDRVSGANRILSQDSSIETLVLDDAYQHRKFEPGLSILLTTWKKPYCNDWYLPTGNLRDWKGASHRAELVIVTKSPHRLDPKEHQIWRDRLSLKPHQQLSFTSIVYGKARPLFDLDAELSSKVVLVSGIADPTDFARHCENEYEVLKHFKFQDHHTFKQSEIRRILNSIGSFGERVGIVTTEKDATRLRAFSKEFTGVPIVYIPIELGFPMGDQDITGLIDHYISEI